MSGSTDAAYSTSRVGTCSRRNPPAPAPIASPMSHSAASTASPVARKFGGRVVPRNDRPTGPTDTSIPAVSR